MGTTLVQGKYSPLFNYLSKQEARRVVLTFEEIEHLLSVTLPRSAYTYQAWWGNTRSGTYVQAAAWLEAGFRVDDVQFGKTVEFVKVSREILTKKKNKVVKEEMITNKEEILDIAQEEFEFFQKITSKMDLIQTFFAQNSHRRFAEEELQQQFDVIRSWRRMLGNIELDMNLLAAQLVKEFLVDQYTITSFAPNRKQEDPATFLYDEKTADGERILATLKTAMPALPNDFGPHQKGGILHDFRKLTSKQATAKYFFVTEALAFRIIQKKYAQHLSGISLVLLPQALDDEKWIIEM
ncbi:hypothetical protein JFL43_07240 [Viridibacillus sp. YIM B01967]|uniref:DUF7662 domain-containing protein n=1 Tax=Viridibacillus soli TaxID=2798301 RepID=A0ABS1H681_9BACL|nr:hypothetical protein [Viridibacillus soli]MBK3494652.1 hypothetical protein [Viridibacillus soli]